MLIILSFQYFTRNELDRWCMLIPGNDRIIARSTMIPSKPITQQSSQTNTKCNDRSKSKCSTNDIVQLACHKRQRIDNVVGSLKNTNSLNELRELIIRREEVNVTLEANIEKENRDVMYRSRLKALPGLCDAIRSKCLTTDKISFKTTDFIYQMSDELSLNPTELSARLQLLSEIVPEYIMLMKRNDLIKYSVISINKASDFKSIRKKVVNSTNMLSNAVKE